MKNKKGKAFAHSAKEKRNDNDFYSTPKSLVWAAEDIIRNEFKEKSDIFEPCSGLGAISEELKQLGYYVIENDLYSNRNDIYHENYVNIETSTIGMHWNNKIITNPPFSLWNDFVIKAKTHCKKFMFIGRLNYFGTQSRLAVGLWRNLKGIFPFSRYVDYRTPYRKDGLFNVGSQATAWFLWDMEYIGNPVNFEVLDVSKWATLGAFKKNEKN